MGRVGECFGGECSVFLQVPSPNTLIVLPLSPETQIADSRGAPEAGFFESRNTPKDDPIIVWIDGYAIPRKDPGHASLKNLHHILMKNPIVVPVYLR